MNPLATASLEEVVRMFRGCKLQFSPEQIYKIDLLLREIKTVQNSLKKSLLKIQRYENATGFDFTRESAKLG